MALIIWVSRPGAGGPTLGVSTSQTNADIHRERVDSSQSTMGPCFKTRNANCKCNTHTRTQSNECISSHNNDAFMSILQDKMLQSKTGSRRKPAAFVS